MRDARLVDGEPSDCPDVPELDGLTEEREGPDGKIYRLPANDEYKYFLGCWNGVFRLLVAEQYSEKLCRRFESGEKLSDQEKREMLDCLLFAAQAYGFGRPDGEDLCQNERAVTHRAQVRAVALSSDGYYYTPYIAPVIDKSILYYEKLTDILLNHSDQLPSMDSGFQRRVFRAGVDLVYLYGHRQDTKTAAFYKKCLELTENDYEARLDILHAMMSGYPRNPMLCNALIVSLAKKWVAEKDPMLKYVVEECNSYVRLNPHQLAADPKTAVEVYSKGKLAGDVYCTYMLGRCVLYGYGVEQDISAGLELLNEAAKGHSISAALLLMKLYAANKEQEENYHQIFKLLLKMELSDEELLLSEVIDRARADGKW